MGDKDPNNSDKQVIKQQRNLSRDLIFQEILTRLPIKSILRFESVSKYWRSTLSSSEFANAHFMKSPFSHPSAPVNTLFIKSDSSYYYIFSYDHDQVSGNFEDNLLKLDIDFGYQKELLELTGSCNGLICLTMAFEYFILWNPATGKMQKYESDGYVKLLDMHDEPSANHGFGYASSIDDYKYVRIVTLLWGNETGNIVHIFSLREKQWRKIDFDNDLILPRDQAVVFNEKLYWLAYSTQAGSIMSLNVLVCFDLAAERFEIFKFGSYHLGILGAMEEYLSMSHWDTNHHTIMHLLKSHTIVKSFRIPESLSLDAGSQLIGCTRTGEVFVTGASLDNGVRTLESIWRRTLHLADTSTEPIKWTTLLRFDEPIKVVGYVPSLVSPIPILESVKGMHGDGSTFANNA
ncbi:F-box/kelch-repeat protein At3g23880-like [Silene latifolia]|uniref:F-box/kelch-repeat protein At3g23880-like n=1 Tax=Silene latifolia TaxID=37657 RepID=UPI003D78387F